MANNKKRKKKEVASQVSLTDKVVGAGKIAGGALTAKTAIESGVPRILGVRLEQHSTSRKKANNLLKTGYIDSSRITKTEKSQPLVNVLQRKFQGALRKGIFGKTLYTPGNDEYFDTSSVLPKKVKVYGSKLGATVEYLKDKGLRSIPDNIKANKGRVGAGLAILGVGGAWAANDIRKGVNKLTGKDKIVVKSYVKKGKLVKSYSRKNKK